jgi:hypothetical protein
MAFTTLDEEIDGWLTVTFRGVVGTLIFYLLLLLL